MKKVILIVAIFCCYPSFAKWIPQNLTTLDFDNLEFTLSQEKEVQTPVANPNKNHKNIQYIPVYIPIKIPVYHPIYIPKYIPIN
jgi:hypothetical protein